MFIFHFKTEFKMKNKRYLYTRTSVDLYNKTHKKNLIQIQLNIKQLKSISLKKMIVILQVHIEWEHCIAG